MLNQAAAEPVGNTELMTLLLVQRMLLYGQTFLTGKGRL
jgi:hypothetical protein